MVKLILLTRNHLQGQETSAILLTWALLMFALHPHTQELVFQEISEVLDGRPPKQSDVSKLRSAIQVSETLSSQP